MKSSLYYCFKNASITRKLYFVAANIALLLTIELFIVWFAGTTLSSTRAYITAPEEDLRWSEDHLLKIRMVIVFTVQISGFLLTILASQVITKRLREISATPQVVANGIFRGKTRVFSKDEIGQLVISFNNRLANYTQNK